MTAYRIIDKEERNAREEMILYTFSELKKQFEPDKEELPEEWSRWNEAQDIEDFRNYLEYFYEGDRVPFNFEEVEIDNLEELKRSNDFLKSGEFENVLWGLE